MAEKTKAERSAELWARFEECLEYERQWFECGFNDDDEDGVGVKGQHACALSRLVELERADALREAGVLRG